MGGAFLGLMGWAAMGFFNGISAVRFTMAVVVATTIANAFANQFFMFELGMGMKGAAWGTNAAQLIGVIARAGRFSSRGDIAREYRSRTHVAARWAVIRAQLVVGLPIGVMYGADVLGLALSQMMIAQTGAVGAAATQIVMALTSMAYMPTIGIALAGTTLVGQSIGAGDRDWANRLGNVVIVLCVGADGYRRGAAAGRRAVGVPLFVSAGDANSGGGGGARPRVAVAGRGLPDLRRPVLRRELLPARRRRHARARARPRCAVVVLLRAARAHADLRAGRGWIDGLPQFGLGAKGGWLALMSLRARC